MYGVILVKTGVSVAIRSLILFLIIVIALATGYFFGNYEQIVTENFVLPKIERVIEDNNTQFNTSFVVDSEGDVLYTNLRSLIDTSYYYEGVTDVDVVINKSTLLAKGKNQCSYIPSEDEGKFYTECIQEETGTYANYILEMTINYKENDVKKSREEKGLVVFIKSPSKLDLFTWQLVRFNRTITKPAE